MADGRPIEPRSSGASALAERAAAARALVRPAWDESRAGHLIERAAARQRRERIARGVGLGGLAVAAGVLLSWSSGRSLPEEPSIAAVAIPEATPPPSGVLRFADGSVVVPLEERTEVLVDAARPQAIELELARGAARFEVTPSLPRTFAVQAAHVTVTVVGTVFTVRRTEVEGHEPDVEVEVLEGTVRVNEEGRETLLHAGERRVFHAGEVPHAALAPAIEPTVIEDAVAPRVAIRAREGEAPEARETSPTEAVVPALPAWRSLADEGRFDEGYALLLSDREALRSDDVETLMLAADCARLSGHPAESLAYLHRALEVGEGDPRAAMISFTLGRVLLSQLRRPEEAAASFARARELSPGGSLASDALAREVEAWSSSGAPDRARARAEEYLSRYPDGVHAAAVRHHGGLE